MRTRKKQMTKRSALLVLVLLALGALVPAPAAAQTPTPIPTVEPGTSEDGWVLIYDFEARHPGELQLPDGPDQFIVKLDRMSTWGQTMFYVNNQLVAQVGSGGSCFANEPFGGATVTLAAGGGRTLSWGPLNPNPWCSWAISMVATRVRIYAPGGYVAIPAFLVPLPNRVFLGAWRGLGPFEIDVPAGSLIRARKVPGSRRGNTQFLADGGVLGYSGDSWCGNNPVADLVVPEPPLRLRRHPDGCEYAYINFEVWSPVNPTSTPTTRPTTTPTTRPTTTGSPTPAPGPTSGGGGGPGAGGGGGGGAPGATPNPSVLPATLTAGPTAGAWWCGYEPNNPCYVSWVERRTAEALWEAIATQIAAPSSTPTPGPRETALAAVERGSAPAPVGYTGGGESGRLRVGEVDWIIIRRYDFGCPIDIAEPFRIRICLIYQHIEQIRILPPPSPGIPADVFAGALALFVIGWVIRR